MKKWKKYGAFMFAMVMCLSFAACGSSDSIAASSEETENAEGDSEESVSYTHLDVYKRQMQFCGSHRCQYSEAETTYRRIKRQYVIHEEISRQDGEMFCGLCR